MASRFHDIYVSKKFPKGEKESRFQRPKQVQSQSLCKKNPIQIQRTLLFSFLWSPKCIDKVPDIARFSNFYHKLKIKPGANLIKKFGLKTTKFAVNSLIVQFRSVFLDRWVATYIWVVGIHFWVGKTCK